MGLSSASLYYKEQKQSLAEVECKNCTQKGHVQRECANEAVCYECLKPGHKKAKKDEIIEHQSEGGESENDGDDESGDGGEDGVENVEKENCEPQSESNAEKPDENVSVVESAEQKEKRELTVQMWLAAAQGASNTPAVGREWSPAKSVKPGKLHQIK